MQDIFQGLSNWVKSEKKFAIATVVQTWGSAPRKTGSGMAVSENQEILGSVSGGCVEGAVIEEALEAIKTGKSKFLDYGISDEDAWTVGLSCGGQIRIYLEPSFTNDGEKSSMELWTQLENCVGQNKACVLSTRMDGSLKDHQVFIPEILLSTKEQGNPLQKIALQAYSERKSQQFNLGEVPCFFHVFPPKSKLLIVGAAHLTTDLVELASLFEFETIVIDPRGIFSEKMVFRKEPDQIYNKWPEEVLNNISIDNYTYAVVLSHDPKIDDQALNILLKSNVAYIGALGSRKTHEKRKDRLRKAGFSEDSISKIHGPVGVNINASLPGEIALSILAEIVQVKNAYL